MIVGAQPSCIQKHHKLRKAIRFLIVAGDIQLIVVSKNRLPTVKDWLSPHDSKRPPIMVNSFVDFDPMIEVGVPTLLICDEGTDPEPFLDGSSRSNLFVIFGPKDLPVGGSGLSLMECDAAYRLEDLERML